MDRFYDRYDLRARLSVAILIISPIVLDLSFCIDYQEGSIAAIVLALITIALSCCGIAAVRYYSDTSKKCSGRDNLAAQMLRQTDSSIPSSTKQRYYYKLKQINPELSPLIDEIDSEKNGYENSRSIIQWLLENTRDNSLFPVLAEEKIGYGFAKNMYVVKPFALITFFAESSLAIIITLSRVDAPCLLARAYKAWEQYSLDIIISATIHLVIFLVWVFIAQERFFCDAERKLAKAILYSIDGMKA